MYFTKKAWNIFYSMLFILRKDPKNIKQKVRYTAFLSNKKVKQKNTVIFGH